VAGCALIFDLDGTLWDSVPWYDNLAGPGTGQSAHAARRLRAAGYTDARFASAAAEAPPPLYPGIADALRAARRRRISLGVATNLPAWMVRPMLAAAGLSAAFAAIVDYGATRRHKPNPEPLLVCAARIGVPPARSFYVGDVETDALAALSAGMGFAWASWGYGSGSPAGAWVLTSAADIDALFRRAP
jgi:HAD superfamily hydrolase (TIGR01509 family)